jgi:hypothetical protein
MLPGLNWPNISLLLKKQTQLTRNCVLTRTLFLAQVRALSQHSYISVAAPVTSVRGGGGTHAWRRYLRDAGAPAEHGALSLRGGRHLLPQKTIR